jgi:predicted metal-binding integral membrane protein DUF2182
MGAAHGAFCFGCCWALSAVPVALGTMNLLWMVLFTALIVLSGFRVPGVGEAKGTTLKNPVTGEDHLVAIDLDQGFIWKRGECGQGSFDVEADGIHLTFEDSNWILYDFDWTNQE